MGLIDPPDLFVISATVRLWPADARRWLVEMWVDLDEEQSPDIEAAVLDGLDRAELVRAFDLARRRIIRSGAAVSLGAIAARLPDEYQVRALDLALTRLKGKRRIAALATIGQRVSAPALRHALGSAGRREDVEDWTAALGEPAPSLASSLAPSLVPAAITLVRRSSDPDRRAPALAQLALRTPDPQRRRLVDEVLRDLREVRDATLFETSTTISTVATPAQATSLIALCRERLKTADLEPLLPDLAQALDDDALLALVRELSDKKPALAEQVLTASAPGLSLDALSGAIDAALGIGDTGSSAIALAELVGDRPQLRFSSLDERALDLALESGDGWAVFRVLDRVGSSLPPERALDAALGIEDKGQRYSSLSTIEPNLPGPLQAQARRELAKMPDMAGGMGAGGGADLETLLAQSPGEATTLSVEALDALVGPAYGARAEPPATAAKPPPTFAEPGEPLPEALPEAEELREAEALPEAEEAPEAEPVPLPKPPGDALTNGHGPEPPRAGAEPPIAAEAPRRNVVSTGFAEPAAPDTPIEAGTTLAAGRPYTFWLEIGAPVAGSIEARATTIEPPKGVARLTVVLFSPDGGFIVDTPSGELRVGPDGSASVLRQPGRIGGLGRRLHFPLTAPTEPGTYRLRCSIVAKGMVLQSRLITAVVTTTPRARRRALVSKLDYRLVDAPNAEKASERAEHRVSVMLNEAGGTHALFVSTGGAKPKLVGSATLDPAVVSSLVAEARGGLRAATWGTEDEWTAGDKYRYAGALDLDQLRTDLVRIAFRGYALFDLLLESLGFATPAKEDTFRAFVRKPSLVQMAHSENPRLVLPVATVYDRRLDTGADPGGMRLCPQFVKDLKNRADLAASLCFKGDCPSSDDDTVVCPSGFWGFRHAIGVPVSFPNAEDAPRRIAKGAARSAVAVISTDPGLTGWDEHRAQLAKVPGLGWTVSTTRDDGLIQVVDRAPQIVYFYCHGGVSHARPFLSVGPKDGPLIFRDTLRDKRVSWTSPRPLVILNGCHTTALGPEVAHQLVGGFIATSGAAGVIGTEVTIFEGLATAFAESCLRRFEAGDMLGWAVRNARLDILAKGNPLGLGYIPFAPADLQLS